MTRSRLLLPLVAVAVAGLGTACCHQSGASSAAEGKPAAGDRAPGTPGAPAGRVVPGEYIFTVAPGTTPAEIAGTFADLAPRRIQPLGGDKILMVFGDDPGLSRLSFRVGDGRILAVQPNFAYQASPRLSAPGAR